MDRWTGYEKSYLQVLVSEEAFHKGRWAAAVVPATLIHKGPGKMEVAASGS